MNLSLNYIFVAVRAELESATPCVEPNRGYKPLIVYIIRSVTY